MRLQGNISRAAYDTAEDFRIFTQWQKYVVYNVLIHLSLTFREEAISPINDNNTTFDSHEVDASLFNSENADAFRDKFRCKSRAEFFRNAMVRGSSIVRHFRNNDLPSGLTIDAVCEAIVEYINGNQRLEAGIDRVRKTAANHNAINAAALSSGKP